ncbi:MAG TPA: methionyl-tRNA formyltransferase [Thermomicrobiales bacterium]|nr:methionyl-tRNA formyltransferase [Thermomicrobiales bacterium]
MESFAAEPIRIVFFGTPAYAVPALEALAADNRVRIPLVVSQPDRPAGRGRRLTAPAVKQTALSLGLPVYQPETLRTENDRTPIAGASADLFVVAAFGKIFGPKLLALPRIGSVNLHASILPDYRGASPISAAILEGGFRTGVTLMGMETGLDTGPILAQRSVDIESFDTTASLTPKLAQLGARLLIDSLDELVSGQLTPIVQDDTEASLTRPMAKADGWIDWSQPAEVIERQIRAMWDWPRAWTTFEGSPLQIHQATILPESAGDAPGQIVLRSEGAAVATGSGQVLIVLGQAAGGKPLPGRLLLERAAQGSIILGAQGAPEAPKLPLIRPVTNTL